MLREELHVMRHQEVEPKEDILGHTFIPSDDLFSLCIRGKCESICRKGSMLLKQRYFQKQENLCYCDNPPT